MNIYNVGQLYHPERRSWPEQVEYNYRDGAHELRMFFARPNAREVGAITKGRAEFALGVQGPVVFLLYRFPPTMPTWSDAPFSIHLVPENQRAIPELPQPFEERALLSIFLVDAATGILRGMRATTFSPEFTADLHAAIAAQSRETWDITKYDAALRRVYASQTSDDLARGAVARCVGGA